MKVFHLPFLPFLLLCHGGGGDEEKHLDQNYFCGKLRVDNNNNNDLILITKVSFFSKITRRRVAARARAMPGQALRHGGWLAGWRGAWGNRGMEKSKQKIRIQQQICSFRNPNIWAMGAGVEGESRHEKNKALAQIFKLFSCQF